MTVRTMKDLVEKLNEASRAYYTENREIMSDYEYDKLYDELVELEKNSGVVLSNSPTQSVGYTALGSLEKASHEIRLLSLDKTKEVSKLKSFLELGCGILSWKLDGLTISLKYNEGELIQAVTRGNGEIGEVVTHNARVFKNLPIKIKYGGELLIRGEAVISWQDFEKLNENLEEKYKNPRNLCSGAVRQLNSRIAAERNVRFYAFSVVKADGIDFKDSKYNQKLWLAENGFETVYSVKTDMRDIEKYVEEFKTNAANNGFATDGLVLTYDSIKLSESLGVTSKFPKDSIAFKWEDELKESKLIGVEWNTSRTGLINPVAVFEPVELEGTTVNKASIHNVSYIEGLRLGLGDTITIYKANMIIPQIAENLTRSGDLEIPEFCPICKSEAVVIKRKEGKALHCPNLSCEAQLVRGLTHFVSRDAMNIEGLSEATIEKFVKNGFLQSYADIYALYSFESEIRQMEGFGEKSYLNLINSIEKSKNVQLPNLIYALGINQVGLNNAKLLCAHFDYEIERIKTAEYNDLIGIDGFGEIIASSVTKFFSDEKNLERLDKIINILNVSKPEVGSSEKILAGKSFVITGDVHIYKNRKALQTHIEELGGKSVSSVSSKTSYLINNDVDSRSSKNKKARELNIPIISEDDFVKIVDSLKSDVAVVLA